MRRFVVTPSRLAGERYCPVVVSVESIARRAASPRVLRKVAEISGRLSSDPYTAYVNEFYERGLGTCGEEWFFMDLLSVLFATAEMGQPENYLEIGVRRGRSVCSVAAASPNTSMYAFDLWEENYANNENPGPALVRAELDKFGYRGPIEFVEGDSHLTVPAFFGRHPDLTLDLVTVDGDHSLDGAWDDLVNVAPRLRVGGVLVFDDTANPYTPGLKEVWQELLKRDPALRGYSFEGPGTGVSFAIRTGEPSPKLAGRKRPWRKKFF